MQPKRPLEFLVAANLRRAVSDYLNSDWSRPPAKYAVSRDLFNAWADSIELPFGRVFRKRSGEDGLYVLQDAEGWWVIRQQCGSVSPGSRLYATYKEAKRAALAWELRETMHASEK